MPACHAGGRGFESRPDRRKPSQHGEVFYFMPHYVYILESLVDGTFYKGYSTDYEKRLLEHNSGLSTYTSSKIPWCLIYVEERSSKKEALIREKHLKRCNKDYLRWLLTQQPNLLTFFCEAISYAGGRGFSRLRRHLDRKPYRMQPKNRVPVLLKAFLTPNCTAKTYLKFLNDFNS
jgi:putative endonuclease